MVEYKYVTLRVNAPIDTIQAVESLTEQINYYAEDGWELDKVVPQVYEGNTDSLLLIFKAKVEE